MFIIFVRWRLSVEIKRFTYLLTYLLADIQQLVYVLGALGRISRGVSLCPCSSP